MYIGEASGNKAVVSRGMAIFFQVWFLPPMTDAPAIAPEDILEFWFGDESPEALADKAKQWWQKSNDFDAHCGDRFGAALEQAKAGELDAWAETPRGALALVILLDQLSRNIHRDTAEMYAGDAKAIAVAAAAVEAGFDETLAPKLRSFLYMPAMHSEELHWQDVCVTWFTKLGEVEPDLAGYVKYAEQHRDIVADWGRFPHRNAILGRESTPEELAFLDKPGSSF